MLWSILICTLNKRKAQFDRLRAELVRQIAVCEATGIVEVLHHADDGQLTIGAKRNQLMQRACGDYVCYVDDDDSVADTYVQDILWAIRSQVPAPDCVGFKGKVYLKGTWYPFVHSLRYKEYNNKPPYERSPNHLNSIKREIVLRYPFLEINWSEDTLQSLGMANDGAIKTEVFVDNFLYFYRPSGKGSKR